RTRGAWPPSQSPQTASRYDGARMSSGERNVTPIELRVIFGGLGKICFACSTAKLQVRSSRLFYMTPEGWRQLEELYHAARALPPTQRTALLDRADPEVRATVVAILARESASEKDGTSPETGALLRPAWEGREDLLKAETPVAAGHQLGPY